jgi:hypothetical protein
MRKCDGTGRVQHEHLPHQFQPFALIKTGHVKEKYWVRILPFGKFTVLYFSQSPLPEVEPG